jgi:hypothetical protein
MMHLENLIPAYEFCTSHNIEISFIRSLHETGLLEISTIEDTVFIQISQLPELEKIIRLYYDLDINLEGIETIRHLLTRINVMQDEIITLKNRLRLYEDTDILEA